MNSQDSFFKKLKSFGNQLGKLATAIVSGLPRQKIVMKPENKTILQDKKASFKTDTEKHYHRPTAKPVVEKQTLLKEMKKKAAH